MSCPTQWYKGQIESAPIPLQRPAPTQVRSAGTCSPGTQEPPLRHPQGELEADGGGSVFSASS